jgi:CBS domain containing-hemolysin-like protein
MAPLVFIYGELFPKQLFLEAPNRLLRRCGPPFLVAGVLFAPVTLMIWAFDRLVRLVVAKSPQEIRFTLARRELEEVLELGHRAGILYPSQQTLVQACLNTGAQPIRNFVTPPARAGHATTDMSKEDMIRLAKHLRRTLLPVEESGGSRIVGFVRLLDLVLSTRSEPPKIQPCVVVKENDSFLAVLTSLIGEMDTLAQVVAENGRTVGYVSAKELKIALWAV